MKKRERWFPIGSHSMPCAYWNVGGRGRGSAGSVWSDDVKESGLNLIPEKLFKNRALLDRDAQEQKKNKNKTHRVKRFVQRVWNHPRTTASLRRGEDGSGRGDRARTSLISKNWRLMIPKSPSFFPCSFFLFFETLKIKQREKRREKTF